MHVLPRRKAGEFLYPPEERRRAAGRFGRASRLTGDSGPWPLLNRLSRLAGKKRAPLFKRREDEVKGTKKKFGEVKGLAASCAAWAGWALSQPESFVHSTLCRMVGRQTQERAWLPLLDNHIIT